MYEEEAGLFFNDHTGEVIEDDVFHQIVNYPNVIVTGHQARTTHTTPTHPPTHIHKPHTFINHMKQQKNSNTLRFILQHGHVG